VSSSRFPPNPWASGGGGGGGSGAPTDASYLVVALNGDLTAERSVAVETNVLTLTDAGANGSLTFGVATGGIGNSKLRNSGALSVIGRSANSSGAPADISATASSDAAFRESGGVLGFGTLATAAYGAATITYAKIQNVSATDKLLGRSSVGAGSIEEIACTSAGRTLIAAADAAAERTALGLGTLATQSGTFSGTTSGTNTGDQTITLTGDVTGSGTGSFAATIAAHAVSNGDLRQSVALAVIGRSANSTGDVADIQATAASDAVLRESGSVLGFGTIATAGIANSAVTDAKLRNGGALTVIGRSANSSGGVADIQATAASDAVLRESGSVLGFGTIATAGIANSAVTDAKLRNGGALTVIGRSANSSGGVADIQASAASGAVLRESGSTLGFGTIATAGIADAAVTLAKQANLANQTAIGRNTAGTGVPEAITATQLLDWIYGTQGGVLYRGVSSWTGLAPGTVGFILKSGGAGANPSWVAATAAETIVALTDGANIAVDASLGDVFDVTLGGNRTMSNPTNATSGKLLHFRVTQDGSGSRTLGWDTNYRFSSDVPSPTLTTAAGKLDYISFRYNSAAGKWDCLAVNKGF